MPTIIIPDKICPHCGGNKWFKTEEKISNKHNEIKVYVRYRCLIRKYEIEKAIRDKIRHTEAFKNKAKVRNSNWYNKNREKAIKNVAEYHLKYPEKRKVIAQRHFRKRVEELLDYYVIGIIKRNNNLNKNNITQELIEINRKSIKLQRQLKQNTCQK
jgi:hypothetical protein